MSAVLDYLIKLESYQEYLEALDPGQLIVLYLRKEQGMNFHEIAEILDITHQAAVTRLRAAGNRLLQAHPNLRPLVQDRGSRSYNRRPRHALTGREQLVLDALANLNGNSADGMTTTELSRFLGIHPNILYGVTRSLVARGLLRRGQRTGRGVPLYLNGDQP